MLDCQTVEENGYYMAAGLSKGLSPVHMLLCRLVPCIVPPMANARCLFMVWGIFPITSKSNQIYTTATRRSPDNVLSVFLSLMRSISHGEQDYHSSLWYQTKALHGCVPSPLQLKCCGLSLKGVFEYKKSKTIWQT